MSWLVSADLGLFRPLVSTTDVAIYLWKEGETRYSWIQRPVREAIPHYTRQRKYSGTSEWLLALRNQFDRWSGKKRMPAVQSGSKSEPPFPRNDHIAVERSEWWAKSTNCPDSRSEGGRDKLRCLCRSIPVVLLSRGTMDDLIRESPFSTSTLPN